MKFYFFKEKFVHEKKNQLDIEYYMLKYIKLNKCKAM
jgi:hypothetical protein